MKFTAKLVGLLNGLSPVTAVSTTGVKREYPDEAKVSLTSTQDGLVVEANNGNVAVKNVLKDQNNLDYAFSAAGSITVSTPDLLNTLKSFDKDDVLDVELKGTELYFVPQSDTEKSQTLPSEVRQIEMPKATSVFEKEAVVSKAALIEATNRTLFAIGFEKFRPEFLYWKLHVEPKRLRVVVGDGGRFPFYDIEGDNVVTATAPTTLLIYKEHNPALLKVISGMESETVTFKESVRGSDDGVPDQIVVTGGSLTATLIGHEPGTKWPDEQAFLARPNNYKFITRSTDWEKEMAGLMATNNADIRNQNITHITLMTIDFKKGLITLKSDHMMKSVRKVKIVDSWVNDGNPEVVEFKATTQILNDMVAQAKGCNLQMELADGIKPMVVKYFAGDVVADGPFHRTNTAAGTKEQYITVFGAYNKKK